MGRKIVVYKLEDETDIYIETNIDDIEIKKQISEDGIEKVSKNREDIESNEKFENLISKIKPVSELIMGSLKDLNNPDEIEVAFGIKFGGKAGIVFASVDSETTFNLKIKWKNN